MNPLETQQRSPDQSESSSVLENSEKLEKEMYPFMMNFLAHGYNFKGYDRDKETLEGAKIKMIDSDPISVNLSEKSKDVDPEKFGEYTVNKEFLDFLERGGNPVFKVLKFPELKGKSKAEVLQHVIDNYGKDYYLPGLESMDFLSKKAKKLYNIDKEKLGKSKIEEERMAFKKADAEFHSKLKGLGNSPYCSGSLLRGKSGKWYIPEAGWANVGSASDPFYNRGRAIALQDEWKDYEGILVAEKVSKD